jgi:hypothetical protein
VFFRRNAPTAAIAIGVDAPDDVDLALPEPKPRFVIGSTRRTLEVWTDLRRICPGHEVYSQSPLSRVNRANAGPWRATQGQTEPLLVFPPAFTKLS